MKRIIHNGKKKYTLIVRKVYGNKYLVQLYTVTNRKKIMKVYGLYDSLSDVEKGLRGKKKPEPWQGGVKYDLPRSLKIYRG